MFILWGVLLIGLPATINALNVSVIQTDFGVGDDVLSENANKLSDDFAATYADFMRTGIESIRFKFLIKQLVKQSNEKKSSSEDDFITCSVCRGIVKIARNILRGSNEDYRNSSKAESAKKAFLDICYRFNILTQEVCDGIFDVHWPAFEFIIQNSDIDTNSICNPVSASFCKVYPPDNDWMLKIDNEGVNFVNSKSKKPKISENGLKILHVTDFHYDPEYRPGALADCPELLCCQRMPTEQVDSSKLAGYWSDYHVCDAPKHMIEDALDHMRKIHTQIDFIYHTGDVIPHTGWKTTREGNKKMFTEIDDLISEKFPNVPVFSCLGNHDAHPSDLFSPANVPDNVNTKWLYEHVYTLWSKWLPQDTKETILRGGYYTVSPRRGFRIISLNNLDCYIYNWWLYYNGTYAIRQLQWLHDTLLGAERAGERVHILAHVPTGESDCWTIWSREFHRLVERFYPIISGIFNGHTHKDELNVYYSSRGEAINIAWNAGSITTFIGKNPNYRIYDVDPQSMEIADFENWTFNLTKANLYGPSKAPEWFKLCHFSKDFTDDLSPAGIDTLLEKMSSQPELLHKYWRCKITNSDPSLAKGCDNECLKTVLCQLATTSFNRKERCHQLTSKLEFSLKSIKEPITIGLPTMDDPTSSAGSTSEKTFKITVLQLTTLVWGYKVLFNVILSRIFFN